MISEPAIDRLTAMFRTPDLTGTRYEIISTLGRGGMGVVYLARDTALEREVALKVFDRPPGEANEARIIARLEHPGIVPVHDFGELPDGRLFYAMKRVRGDRLDRWMAAGRDITERLAVFLRVCEAVAFAHAHGVVHRDLKPENVMVGEFGEVLVVDWGVAATADIADCGLRPSTGSGRPEALEGRIAESKAIVGTPEYMAPEQARGDAAIDQRADVFALGAMLAGIGRGVAPVVAIARKAQSAEAPQRYQSVPALAADVNRYLAGRAVEAHSEPFIDRISRVARRHRLPILLVLTYLVVRVLLIWFFRV
jgi:serine/threonine protein kinase